jgi:hypothetical protein
MRLIKLKINNSGEATSRFTLRGALKLSQWLKDEYGLVRERDYDWYFMTRDDEFHLRFFGEQEKDFEGMETFLLLKWPQGFI